MVTNSSISVLPFLPPQDVNCVSTIFEGMELLKANPAMRTFSGVFQKLDRLKQLLTPNLAKEVGMVFMSVREHAAEM